MMESAMTIAGYDKVITACTLQMVDRVINIHSHRRESETSGQSVSISIINTEQKLKTYQNS
jgi:hypothetical protein